MAFSSLFFYGKIKALVIMTVLSANIAVAPCKLGMSLTLRLKSVGPRMLPWGTLTLIGLNEKTSELNWTTNWRSSIKEKIMGMIYGENLT